MRIAIFNDYLCINMGKRGVERARLFNKKEYYLRFVELLDGVTK